ncbi:MAG: hypothetical protein EKK63_15850 [Acinetobacter sp.]|uniref:hypothetical protein n=1 Tax=Acinetobacter sp. TaxID=472 RepID=UPI000F9C8169|nr:hypothetical protein [Acinetobacter sp.]RUP37042.1 MAG: hypothetical protein EKK63_15850 [Acinetobacter sp.]
MLEAGTITLSWSMLTGIAALIFAFGGCYWLLIHIGKEGSKIKDKVNQHAEMHVEHKAKIENLNQQMLAIGSDTREIKSDIKDLLKRHGD